MTAMTGAEEFEKHIASMDRKEFEPEHLDVTTRGSFERREENINAPSSMEFVSRASIEYVLPSKMTPFELHEFFEAYDTDGDGKIDFAEFVALYPRLREKWRFEHVWAEFQVRQRGSVYILSLSSFHILSISSSSCFSAHRTQHIDESGDGHLEMDELRALVPQGSSEEELKEWMERFDRGGKGYITLSDFVAIDSAVQRDVLLVAIGTSFVLCTYFVYSRVTKALLSVFSMENVEGVLYLKRELGSPAFTLEHQVMMGVCGIYLFLFSLVVPLVGLYLMYQVRHLQAERRVATMAGFLMDGYRVEVAWFWEFVILTRKLIILGISLFIAEPFMQSFIAIIVIIIALSIQLFFHPFELVALNVLEIASLASLLATQLGGVLMWYKQQPGRSDGIEYYRAGATVVLFGVNGAVVVGFVVVAAWFWFKQKSKMIVQWCPCTLPLFTAIVRVEETARWPNGTALSTAEIHLIRDEWSYFGSMRQGRLFGHGPAHGARKNVKKMTKKLEKVLERMAASGKKVASASEASASEGGGGVQPIAENSDRGVVMEGGSGQELGSTVLGSGGGDGEEEEEGGGGEGQTLSLDSLALSQRKRGKAKTVVPVSSSMHRGVSLGTVNPLTRGGVMEL